MPSCDHYRNCSPHWNTGTQGRRTKSSFLVYLLSVFVNVAKVMNVLSAAAAKSPITTFLNKILTFFWMGHQWWRIVSSWHYAFVFNETGELMMTSHHGSKNDTIILRCAVFIDHTVIPLVTAQEGVSHVLSQPGRVLYQRWSSTLSEIHLPESIEAVCWK